MMAETRYARTADGTHVAYQVTGDGPIDLLVMRSWHSHLEHEWEEPVLAGILRRLGALGRVIRLDRRGTGQSDRFDPSLLPTLEARIDDIRATLDAAGTEQVIPIGLAHGGALCSYFAAAYPERTAGLVLFGPVPYMFGHHPPGDIPTTRDEFLRTWGTRETARATAEFAAPSRAGDQDFVTWIRDEERLAGTAEQALAQWELVFQTNIAGILPSIHVPTMVVWRAGSPWPPPPLDSLLPNATLVELPGDDHALIAGDWLTALGEIERFIDAVGGLPHDVDRVLAIVMFTDVVGSTEHAVRLGDAGWAELLERHHAIVRRELARYRGREIDTAGDGFFASFDGPARAIRCAVALREAVAELGISIRIGLHSGECERVGGRLRGMAVHVGARIGASAAPDEVLVSSTIRDLVAGSGITFEDAGMHELKGVPDAWHLYRVTST